MALRYTRVLLKLSGEALAGREPYGIDPGTVSGFCAEIAEVVRLGAQLALVIGGGIIPEEDVPALKQAGLGAIFGPGTRTQDIVDFIKSNLKRKLD